MLLCRFPLDVVSCQDTQGKIRITVSMYRSNVDSGYKALIEKQVATGVFDDYIVALMHWLLQNGKEFEVVFRPPISIKIAIN